MKFFLIRHAETTAGAKQVILGKNEEGRLSQRGKRQAKALAKLLSKEKISEIYCSTSKRCRQTAKALTEKRRCKVIFCDELREIDMGKLAGLSHEEAEEKYPHIFEGLFANPSKKLPGGESLFDVEARTMPLINKLAKREGNPTIVAIGHNITNRVILASLLGLPLKKARNIKQKNACISMLDVKKGFAQLYTLNNSLHAIK